MRKSNGNRFILIGLSVILLVMAGKVSGDNAAAVSNYDRNSIYLKSGGGCAGSFFILGGRPFRLMNMYKDLAPVMKICPSAMEQLELYKKEMRNYWIWYGIAWIPAIAGAVIAIVQPEDPDMSLIAVGLELSAFIPLGIAVIHANKAGNYGQKAIWEYNRCAIQLKTVF